MKKVVCEITPSKNHLLSTPRLWFKFNCVRCAVCEEEWFVKLLRAKTIYSLLRDSGSSLTLCGVRIQNEERTKKETNITS